MRPTLDADAGKLGGPVTRTLGAERLGRREIDGLVESARLKQADDGELEDDRLARACRRRDNHVVIAVHRLSKRANAMSSGSHECHQNKHNALCRSTCSERR